MTTTVVSIGGANMGNPRLRVRVTDVCTEAARERGSLESSSGTYPEEVKGAGGFAGEPVSRAREPLSPQDTGDPGARYYLLTALVACSMEALD